MQRREFLGFFNKIAAVRNLLPMASLPVAALAGPRRVLLQTSAVAGFQYHAGEAAWPGLSVGQALSLLREPGNRHDPRAIEIWAGQHKLGYLPRIDNCAASQLMDRGAKLYTRIMALERNPDPWRRVSISVELDA